MMNELRDAVDICAMRPRARRLARWRSALQITLGRAVTHAESAIHTHCFRLCELRPMRSRPMPLAALP